MDKELEEVSKFYNIIVEFVANYSLQIVGALIIFIIGVIASKYVQKLVYKLLINNKIDETLSGFVSNFVRFLVVAMMAILALGKLGISIAPFIAALGAISLTAGLALQGSVSNFAAGIILVITVIYFTFTYPVTKYGGESMTKKLRQLGLGGGQ